MRICSKCKKNEVCQTPTKHKYGHYWCSPCMSKASIESARRHRDIKRKNNKKYLKSNKGKLSRKRANTKYRKNNKEKIWAQNKVRTALRNGTLTRLSCIICNKSSSHAHHEDYTKPLEIQWLCHNCHMEHHYPLLKEDEMYEKGKK